MICGTGGAEECVEAYRRPSLVKFVVVSERIVIAPRDIDWLRAATDGEEFAKTEKHDVVFGKAESRLRMRCPE